MRFDLGDSVVDVTVTAKRHPTVTWHFGRVRRPSPAERRPGPSDLSHPSPRLDVIMDLQADKGVEILLPGFTDEMENPVPTPEGTVLVYTTDRGDLVSLTDNGDGTWFAGAVGPLGNAVVHLDATVPLSDGTTKDFTGDLLLSVVPGDVARVVIRTGEVREVTPDA